jgi:hypothetical protein
MRFFNADDDFARNRHWEEIFDLVNARRGQETFLFAFRSDSMHPHVASRTTSTNADAPDVC